MLARSQAQESTSTHAPLSPQLVSRSHPTVITQAWLSCCAVGRLPRPSARQQSQARRKSFGGSPLARGVVARGPAKPFHTAWLSRGRACRLSRPLPPKASGQSEIQKEERETRGQAGEPTHHPPEKHKDRSRKLAYITRLPRRQHRSLGSPRSRLLSADSELHQPAPEYTSSRLEVMFRAYRVAGFPSLGCSLACSAHRGAAFSRSARPFGSRHISCKRRRRCCPVHRNAKAEQAIWCAW